jgi:hypothetical protein
MTIKTVEALNCVVHSMKPLPIQFAIIIVIIIIIIGITQRILVA